MGEAAFEFICSRTKAKFGEVGNSTCECAVSSPGTVPYWHLLFPDKRRPHASFLPGKSREISQKGSMVVETPPHRWQVTSDCHPPVKIWSMMQSQGFPLPLLSSSAPFTAAGLLLDDRRSSADTDGRPEISLFLLAQSMLQRVNEIEFCAGKARREKLKKVSLPTNGHALMLNHTTRKSHLLTCLMYLTNAQVGSTFIWFITPGYKNL